MNNETPDSDAEDSTVDKRRIMFVDDDVVLCNMFESAASRQGYEALVVSDSSQAIEKARFFQPDPIFLDLDMPGMSGDKIAAAIREDPSLRAAPVVFLSALIAQEDLSRHDGRPVMQHEYLAKPASLKDIFEVIERHMV